MRRLSELDGPQNAVWDQGTWDQCEISSLPRTANARISMERESIQQLFKIKGHGQNVIVKCEAQSGTKALPLGHGLGARSMNELWAANGAAVKYDNPLF